MSIRLQLKNLIFITLVIISTTNLAIGNDKKIALVIGNNNYKQVGRLKLAVNDATSVANALKELGFKVTIKTDIDLLTLKSAVTTFGKQAQSANVALLFFSGHGLQINGENILVPIDYSIENPSGGFSVHAAQKIMQDATIGTKIIILDACRNEERIAKSGLSGKGLAPMIPLKEFIIMYSTAAGETASDGTDKNSPYTAALLQHIKEPIPIETLFKRVAKTVTENTDPPQLPANYTAGLTGDFCFTGCGVEVTNTEITCRLNIGQGIYEGECRNGQANGQGVQRYADGEYYTGNFQRNMRHGYGIQYLTDGTEISGNWKRGRLIND